MAPETYAAFFLFFDTAWALLLQGGNRVRKHPSYRFILIVGVLGLLVLRGLDVDWPLLVIVGVFLCLAAALAWWQRHGKYD